ncbi:MAG: hypothetical protein OJF52_003178 [Nitrospira sp.]|jgi:hypothetical protein|nr:MAG: hypothetical protein OJF52_003178 [Nitrospira sp.]
MDLRADLFKGGAVHRLLNQRQSFNAAVQDLVDKVAAERGRHGLSALAA